MKLSYMLSDNLENLLKREEKLGVDEAGAKRQHSQSFYSLHRGLRPSKWLWMFPLVELASRSVLYSIYLE